METFPPITDSVSLSIPAYMRDHRLGNQAVLPAVEALRILSDTVRTHWPRADVSHMRDIVFSRLLPIGPDDITVNLFVKIRPASNINGDIAAVLLTRFTSKSGTVTRMKEHISAIFLGNPPKPPPSRPSDRQSAADPAGFTLTAGRLYRELVPFGPGFQSLTGNVHLSPARAIGSAGTPASAHPSASPLGSPFPLDAAFHVACAWGQRYAGTVVYPATIGARTIIKPTAGNEPYTTHVRPLKISGETLTFDMWIESPDGELFETIREVVMRPIRGISSHPPDWIIA